MLMSETPRYGAGLTNDKLWYDAPAGEFLNALPIGTGRLAAMVFGGARLERIALNHEWLWRGKHRQRDTAHSAAHLAEVRRLLLAERWGEADVLANDAFAGLGGTSGKPNRVDPYQPAGDLYIESGHDTTHEYRRELDLATAQTTVTFNGEFRHETIAHLTEDRILIRLTYSGANAPGIKIWLDRVFDPDCKLRFQTTPAGLRMDGRFADGIRFRVQAAVRTDGQVSVDRGRLLVQNAREIILAINIGVGVRGRKADVECGPLVVPAGTWDELLATHRREHQEQRNTTEQAQQRRRRAPAPAPPPRWRTRRSRRGASRAGTGRRAAARAPRRAHRCGPSR